MTKNDERTDESRTPCRSSECGCTVPEGQEHCSPYCESGVAPSLPRRDCACGHAGCQASRLYA